MRGGARAGLALSRWGLVGGLLFLGALPVGGLLFWVASPAAVSLSPAAVSLSLAAGAIGVEAVGVFAWLGRRISQPTPASSSTITAAAAVSGRRRRPVDGAIAGWSVVMVV